MNDIGGAAAATVDAAARAESSFVAWLFQPEAHPRQVTRSALAAPPAEDESLVWVDLRDVGADVLNEIGTALGFPTTVTQAALDSRSRPRVRTFGEHFVVAVATARRDAAAQDLRSHELIFIVGPNVLVSTHKAPSRLITHVMRHESEAPSPMKLTSVLLLFVLMQELLILYEELTEDLIDEIEAMEERALTDLSDAFLADLLALKRLVFAVYRLARHHRPVLTALQSPDFPLIGRSDAEPYFRDLEERLARLLDGLEAAKESVDGAFDLYVSQISRRTNDIMKVLAIVSTVLLPWTVILSYFGTSFQNPPVATAAAFPIMIALIVVVTVMILLLFSYFGWLEGTPFARPSRHGRPQRKPTLPSPSN